METNSLSSRSKCSQKCSSVIKVKKDILEKTEICAETYRLRFRPSILEDD